MFNCQTGLMYEICKMYWITCNVYCKIVLTTWVYINICGKFFGAVHYFRYKKFMPHNMDDELPKSNALMNCPRKLKTYGNCTYHIFIIQYWLISVFYMFLLSFLVLCCYLQNSEKCLIRYPITGKQIMKWHRYKSSVVSIIDAKWMCFLITISMEVILTVYLTYVVGLYYYLYHEL